MASQDYRSLSSREPVGSLAVLARRRERLALISSRSKLCGVAAYTAALDRQLAGLFEVTVFDLDQYMLRNRDRRVRKLADRHIKEICAALADFDAVNLQLEYGMLGLRSADIRRRISWLVDAAPRLSVTFHTLKRPAPLPKLDFVKAVLTGRWRTAGDIYAECARNKRLSLGIARHLRRVQRRKPVSIIVHNRRDRRETEQVQGFERVFDHPLAFLSSAEADAVTSQAKRRRFPLLDPLTSDDQLIGVFGFLNDYKGFETVVRALYHLPKTYHLLIFGGIHPNEIAPHRPIHPYLLSLLGTAHVDATPSLNAPHSEYPADDRAGPHPRDLSPRVHFMGALDDADFLAGMAICDVVVFPYLEVGQSASGPMSQAVELGRRIIATRTHTFIEFAEYHPDAIEFFEIGNHLELAKRIVARPQYAGRRARPRYNVETNKAVYLAANSAEPEVSRPGRRRDPPQASAQAGD
jgi:glycosyltransferase involved in cell wall biosynthesis